MPITQAIIIVPNWNGAALLRTFLPATLAQPARALVIDNGSTDDSINTARELGAEVLPLPRNQGFAAAVNQGIAATTEPFIAIVNNDVRLAPDWLPALQTALDQTGAHLAVGKILREREPDRIDGTYDLLSLGATALRAGFGEPAATFANTRRAIHFAPLTAALVRREAFEQAGPLDEDFESYLEDVEFSLRCARLGLRGVYEPSAQAWHRGSATLGAWHPDTTRRIARNQMMIAAKHFPDAWPKRNLRIAQGLWGLVAAKHGAGAAYFAGKKEGREGYARWRAASQWWRREDNLRAILDESEAELRTLARDRYWRWYFSLTGGAPGD